MSTTSAARVAGVVLVLLAMVVAPARTGATTTDLDPLEVNDPAVTSGMAWHLDAIGARVAWRSSLGASVRVAVVDSGVDSTHPDLLGQVDDSVTCIGAAGDADGCVPGGIDDDGHGTHVAGIIAARADDNIGVAGVAPRAKILSVKTLQAGCDDQGCVADGDAGDVAAGIRWAIGKHADVINLSVSAPYRLAPDILDAIGEAWDGGAVVVLSAGKRTEKPIFFDTSSALVVTATDRNGDLAPHAPRLSDDAIAVAAPGGLATDTAATCHESAQPVGIVSSVPVESGDGSGYECLGGSSMAAAQVSGGLALLLSMGFSRDEAVDRLLGTAVPGDGLALGRIDLAAAVARPYPPGVSNRHDAVETGILPPPNTELPSTGPFSVMSAGDDGDGDDPAVPLWAVMVVGALVVGLLAEMTLRVLSRRRAAGAAPVDASTPGVPQEGVDPGASRGPDPDGARADHDTSAGGPDPAATAPSVPPPGD